jgi:hypothetical protein
MKRYNHCTNCMLGAVTQLGDDCPCGGNYDLAPLLQVIGRHDLTPEQGELATMAGLTIKSVGDIDAFTGDGCPFLEGHHYVAVAHAAMALRLTAENAVGSKEITIGVFENANRAKEGERPTFEAVALHLYTPQGRGDGLMESSFLNEEYRLDFD